MGKEAEVRGGRWDRVVWNAGAEECRRSNGRGANPSAPFAGAQMGAGAYPPRSYWHAQQCRRIPPPPSTPLLHRRRVQVNAHRSP
jgi:hypothetical protein